MEILHWSGSQEVPTFEDRANETSSLKTNNLHNADWSIQTSFSEKQLPREELKSDGTTKQNSWPVVVAVN